jgi:hypothetical protein
MRSAELWNFSVYMYNAHNDLLEPVWRDRHPDHPSGTGNGRVWKPGVGHIGLAFSQQDARITADARVPGSAELLRLPSGYGRAYDEATYVSFVSQPIPRSPELQPWGVIVATSNVPGRFTEVNGLALRHAAAELGTILSLAYNGPVPISFEL